MSYLLKITPILLTSLLVGCGANPLASKPVTDVARLLTDASEDAMKSMEKNARNVSDRYRLCMEHKTPATFSCETLYQKMAESLASKGILACASDIKDQALYARIKEELENRSYFTL